jgi:hypothetical protein
VGRLLGDGSHAHLAHSALRRYARPADDAPAEARPVTALFAAFTPE